ncbi:MAG TPA: hypothetical protein VLW53_07780 [Candidatus Eisenbacteria bacterium]|nr:hypothetical protein [Candidatus Eisenbacteria bacterium]
MRRYWYLAIAGVIASALAILPLSAFAAAAVLTVSSTSGPAVANGDTLTGTLSGNATFTNKANSSQFVTCTSSTIAAIGGDNPVPQGIAKETVTGQTFGSCTITGVPGATGVNSVNTNATTGCPWNASIDDHTSPATVTISPSTVGGCPTSIQATVNVQTIFGPINCVYQPHGGTIPATAKLASSEGIRFTNAQWDKVSGPGTCFTNALFSALYPFVDATQGNGAVFAN